MQLHLLGTTGYHPSDTRQTACLMLPEIGVLLDAGSGMFRAGRHLATDTLDIYLSHAHLDHCSGLTFLFDVLSGRTMERVTVHAEEAKLVAIREHLLAELIFPVALPCVWKPLCDGGCALPGGGRISHFALAHPGGSVGFRLDWPDRSLAYVTDTTAAPDASYVDAIRDVDLLVHDSFFSDDASAQAELTGHSCLSAVCEVAAAANVGRLLLVHINPMADQAAPFDLVAAKRIFEHTAIGEDEMIVEF